MVKTVLANFAVQYWDVNDGEEILGSIESPSHRST